MRALRIVLILDSAALFLLGLVFIVAPMQVARAFHFADLPPAVGYLIAVWGCGLATMGFGYLLAALSPIRNVAWVQVGIARGLLECVVGLTFITKGIVTFQQVGLGTVAGAMFALAYILFYPRGERPAEAEPTVSPTDTNPQPTV